jgi:hypothetical protein
MGVTIEEIIISLKLEAKNLTNKIKSSNNAIKKNGEISKVTSKRLKKLSQVQSKIGNLAKRNQRQFAGWALSMMFFGMAIKRVFDSLWKAGQKTFQEVAHSVDGSVTSFDMLNASIEILKYAVGSALNSVLEPLMPMIWNIVDRIDDWISGNEKLFGWFVIIGSAIGGLLMTFGMLKLGIDGLITAGLKLAPVFTQIGIAISSIGTGLIAALVAFLVVFIGLWVANIGQIQELFKETFGIIFSAIYVVFKELIGILSNIWKFIMAIFTGDWDKALGYLWKALVGIFKLMAKAGIALSNVFYNTFVWVVNSIKDLFLNMIKGILSISRAISSALGLDTSRLDKQLKRIEKLKGSLSIDYKSISGTKEQYAQVDKLGDWMEGQTTTKQTINYFINPSADEISSEVKRMNNPTTI